MRVGLRADSSETIGTGHVMRQMAVAQFLIRQGHSVFLLSSLAGPRWLNDYVLNLPGLQVIQVGEGNFGPESVQTLGLDALLIDSYQVSQPDLDLLEGSAGRIAVMLDGPWQSLSGAVAIAPTFEAESKWLRDASRNFTQLHSGPQYFPLREEVLVLGETASFMSSHETLPSVVISMGGCHSALEEFILRVTLELVNPLQVDIFFLPNHELWRKILDSPHVVTVHPRGIGFLELVWRSHVTISAAGSVAAELFYLGVPTIFVPVAGNQSQNASSITRLKLGTVLWPSSEHFASELSFSLDRLINGGAPSKSFKTEVDSAGAERIAEAILF